MADTAASTSSAVAAAPSRQGFVSALGPKFQEWRDAVVDLRRAHTHEPLVSIEPADVLKLVWAALSPEAAASIHDGTYRSAAEAKLRWTESIVTECAAQVDANAMCFADAAALYVAKGGVRTGDAPHSGSGRNGTFVEATWADVRAVCVASPTTKHMLDGCVPLHDAACVLLHAHMRTNHPSDRSTAIVAADVEDVTVSINVRRDGAERSVCWVEGTWKAPDSDSGARAIKYLERARAALECCRTWPALLGLATEQR